MKKVLIVDDSASMRKLIVFTLEKEGFELFEAADGKEALEMLRAVPMDMVITDLNMPVMNGVELIRSLRADPACRFIPVIMLTTESAGDRRNEGKEAGATGWIVKPFRPEQLAVLVRRLTG